MKCVRCQREQKHNMCKKCAKETKTSLQLNRARKDEFSNRVRAVEEGRFVIVPLPPAFGGDVGSKSSLYGSQITRRRAPASSGG